MNIQILANQNFTKKKNRNKKTRTILQIIFFLALLGFIAWIYFSQPVYRPYADEAPRENGFIALSYFGVQKTEGSQLLISQANLQAHLQALKNQGYETVTTDDIYEYYANGKQLPEKALYLMFEDGRRDTAIFSTPILEDLNYRATAFTYPEKFERKDPKFLLPDDLKEIVKDRFWDVGTNGYRLFFINVFDRYDNYFGELDPLMFNQVAPYLGRRYNHYLMDYIRDKNGVPKESFERMKNRIGYDYQKLEAVYQKDLGYVPKVSVLMHANTSEFGNNPQVSAVNGYWLRKLFEMNFNREGYALNVPNSSIYDLTRMQPQAWWPVNHLLMRIKYDTNKEMIFNTGEVERYERWDLAKGAAEFKDEKIYLTTLPYDTGIIKLKNSYSYRNVNITTKLEGNTAGTQAIYLRSDNDLQNYIAVKVRAGFIYIVEKTNGREAELYKKSLDELNGVEPISVDQDKYNSERTALEAFSRYAPSEGIAKVYVNRLKEKTKEEPKTIDEGSPQYVPQINARDKEVCDIAISLNNNDLKLSFNGKEITSQKVSNNERGSICLAAGYTDLGWQQRNLDDDVYDAVFRDFTVKDINTDSELFTSKYSGWEKIEYNTKKYAELIVDWFVHYL